MYQKVKAFNYYLAYKEIKMSSKLPKCRRKQKDAPRVGTPKNRSECERKIIKSRHVGWRCCGT